MAVEYLGTGNDDGVVLGRSITDKVGMYGVTPVAQRTATIQATSFLSASSNVTIGATTTAWVLEVTNTLIALGIWKGA